MRQGAASAEGIKGILVERDEGYGLLTCGYNQTGYKTSRVAYANCPCAVFDFLGATADEAGGTGAAALEDGRGLERLNLQIAW